LIDAKINYCVNDIVTNTIKNIKHIEIHLYIFAFQNEKVCKIMYYIIDIKKLNKDVIIQKTNTIKIIDEEVLLSVTDDYE